MKLDGLQRQELIINGVTRMKRNNLFLGLSLALALPVFADTFDVLVVDNAYDLNPEPFESAQLESASRECLKYLDRVVYSPTPINLGLSDVAFISETLGAAGVRFLAPGDAHEAELGLDSRFSYTQSQLIALGADYVSSYYALNQSISIDSETRWDVAINRLEPSELYYTLAHELLHGLGFNSRLSVFGENDPLNGQWGGAAESQPSIFDSFMRSSGDLVVDMGTNEERAEVFYNQDNVVFSGPVTNLYAQELLSFGASDGVQLNASATYQNITLSHFSYSIDPDVVMEPSGGTEMFVSFAVLADMGYGDMLDTLLTTHSVQASNTVFSVRSETLQDRASLDSIILTIPATDGITVDSAQDGVNCTTLDSSVACSLDGSYATNADHLVSIDFDGIPGVYDLMVDVEHRAPHVDANPLNNFLSVSVQVGVNPVTGVALDPSNIDEGTAADTLIGSLSVISSADFAGNVVYSLVQGEGDTHNGNIDLVDGQIVSSAVLDHENVSSLSIRVEALLDNGFSFQEQLSIAVNDTNVDGCFNNRVVMNDLRSPMLFPFVSTAYASSGAVTSSTIPAVIWLLNLVALAAARRSKTLRGNWKIALVALLAVSLVGCGGGGGESSVPPVTSC